MPISLTTAYNPGDRDSGHTYPEVKISRVSIDIVGSNLQLQCEYGSGLAAWAASTAYALGDRIINGGNVYLCTVAGTSAASGGPTGTTTDIVDNTVTWNYVSAGTVGQWQRGIGSPDERHIIRDTITGTDFTDMVAKLCPDTTTTIYDAAAQGLYQYLLDKSLYAGTIV